jgi:hypothetical protein
MILLTLAPAAFAATPSDYPDVDVISVIPRSPNIKPLVMSISTRDRRLRAATHTDAKTGTGRS